MTEARPHVQTQARDLVPGDAICVSGEWKKICEIQEYVDPDGLSHFNLILDGGIGFIIEKHKYILRQRAVDRSHEAMQWLLHIGDEVSLDCHEGYWEVVTLDRDCTLLGAADDPTDAILAAKAKWEANHGED